MTDPQTTTDPQAMCAVEALVDTLMTLGIHRADGSFYDADVVSGIVGFMRHHHGYIIVECRDAAAGETVPVSRGDMELLEKVAYKTWGRNFDSDPHSPDTFTWHGIVKRLRAALGEQL